DEVQRPKLQTCPFAAQSTAHPVADPSDVVASGCRPLEPGLLAQPTAPSSAEAATPSAAQARRRRSPEGRSVEARSIIWMWVERSPDGGCATRSFPPLPCGCATGGSPVSLISLRAGLPNTSSDILPARSIRFSEDAFLVENFQVQPDDEPCQAQCARATIFPRWYVRRS